MISLLRAAGTKCLAPALTHLRFRFQQSGPVCSLSWGGGTPGCCAVLAPGASGAARSRGRGAECLLGPGSAQGPPPGPRPPRPPLGIEAASLAQTNTRAHYTDLRLWRPLEAVGRQLLWQVPRAAPQPRDPPGREKARDCPSFPPGSQLKGGARPCAQPRPPSPFLPCHSPRLTPGRPQHCSPYLSPGRERQSHGQSRRTVHSPAWQNGHFISGPYCPRLLRGDPGPATASPATRYKNIVPR